MHEIRKIRERAHQRKRKPIACRLSDANLVFNVVREVRKRVALLQTAILRDLFVATRKRNRLKRQERDLLWIVESETNDRADLVIVDTVDQGRNQYDFNTR